MESILLGVLFLIVAGLLWRKMNTVAHLLQQSRQPLKLADTSLADVEKILASFAGKINSTVGEVLVKIDSTPRVEVEKVDVPTPTRQPPVVGQAHAVEVAQTSLLEQLVYEKAHSVRQVERMQSIPASLKPSDPSAAYNTDQRHTAVIQRAMRAFTEEGVTPPSNLEQIVAKVMVDYAKP